MKKITAIIGLMRLIGLVSLIAYAQAPQFTTQETAGCGAQANGQYVLCEEIPGFPKEFGGVAEYIRTIFNYALMLGGIIVFLLIIYGGLTYIFSGGNPTKQNDARDIIWQAIWGLALLLGSFLILNTVNPRLLELQDIPSAIPLEVSDNALFNLSSSALFDTQNRDYINKKADLQDKILSLELEVQGIDTTVESGRQRAAEINGELSKTRAGFVQTQVEQLENERRFLGTEIDRLESYKIEGYPGDSKSLGGVAQRYIGRPLQKQVGKFVGPLSLFPEDQVQLDNNKSRLGAIDRQLNELRQQGQK